MIRVIKIGGNVIDDQHRLDMVLDACASMSEPLVLVHGGGKVATELAERMGVQQQMIDGRRITDAETLRIVTMVYGGLLNKSIVAGLVARGVSSVGITGADGDAVRAHKRTHPTIDYGFVGDVDTVNVEFFAKLLQAGHRIVCAPLTHDGAGTMLNTNADTMAAEIAAALTIRDDVELTYVFDHAGVLRDIEDPASAIQALTRAEAERLVTEGVITAGMLPKLENAFRAVERGVPRVRITRWDMLNAGTIIR